MGGDIEKIEKVMKFLKVEYGVMKNHESKFFREYFANARDSWKIKYFGKKCILLIKQSILHTLFGM